MNVVVIGAGMYVCGRGTEEFGTVMPALCEWSRGNALGQVHVAATRRESAEIARQKIEELQRRTGVAFSVRYFPEDAATDPASYRDAIRHIPRPACAIVVIPDHLHHEVARTAIKEGLHTLVVKPLTPTLAEARELIEIQREHRRYCAVEFHKRLDRANLKLRDAVCRGVIGDPLYVVVEYSQRKSVPAERFRAWVSRTNSFQYLGVHYVDIVYFATGGVPRRAMATAQMGWLRSKGVGAYDAVQGTVEWEIPSGHRFASHILTSWVDPESTSAMSDQRIAMIGTKGRIELDQKRRGIMCVSDEHGIEEPNPDFCVGYGDEGQVTYRGYGIDSIRQFLDDVVAVEGGWVTLEELEAERPTFRQALVSTAVVEAVNASLESDGEWVKIPDLEG